MIICNAISFALSLSLSLSFSFSVCRKATKLHYIWLWWLRLDSEMCGWCGVDLIIIIYRSMRYWKYSYITTIIVGTSSIRFHSVQYKKYHYYFFYVFLSPNITHILINNIISEIITYLIRIFFNLIFARSPHLENAYQLIYSSDLTLSLIFGLKFIFFVRKQTLSLARNIIRTFYRKNKI